MNASTSILNLFSRIMLIAESMLGTMNSITIAVIRVFVRFSFLLS